MDRKHVVFRAFRGYQEPKKNQQEVVHASWKLRDPSNIKLLGTTFFDVRDSLLLVSGFDGFVSGSFAGGSGANHIERGAKKAYTVMEAAVRYGEELRKFLPVIKAEDGSSKEKKEREEIVRRKIPESYGIKRYHENCGCKGNK